jgi:CRISPR system Cascade subunit CasD
MSSAENTLFLRLAGPMQAWGTASRLQLRRTDAYPSKSGVLGLLLCAMGISRKDSGEALDRLVELSMGVRVDRAGTLDWDYQTAGAKIGIRKAEAKGLQVGDDPDKTLKKTAKTDEFETLLSYRQYLYDASFLVALHGEWGRIGECVAALNDPIWPVFLGRKCCVPGEPVFAGVGSYGSLTEALSDVPWRARIDAIDRDDRGKTRTLDTFTEHPLGSPPPDGARLVHDVPRVLGYYNHGARWVVAGQVTVPVGDAMYKPPAKSNRFENPYGPQYDAARLIRLEMDNHLCVFCKSPAIQMHHVDYADTRPETLRSLCKICHDACTALEYGQDRRKRIDPSDPVQRPLILRQVARNLVERRLGRRRALLESARSTRASVFDFQPDSSAVEGH